MSDNFRWARAAALFAIVYLAVGVLFPNPSAADAMQFAWRLAAWLICFTAFLTHIWFERSRLRSLPRRAALHVAAAVAVGGLGLAAVANIHARVAGSGNLRLLALALVIWPVMTALPAFVVALAVASGLARLRPRQTQHPS